MSTEGRRPPLLHGKFARKKTLFLEWAVRHRPVVLSILYLLPVQDRAGYANTWPACH